MTLNVTRPHVGEYQVELLLLEKGNLHLNDFHISLLITGEVIMCI